MQDRTVLSLLLVITIVMLSLVGGVLDAYAAISAEERAALIALYNSTNGDGWTDNSGWKEPPLDTDDFAMPGTEGSWHGISLNKWETSVDQIDLYQNNLDGTIPASLGNLANLRNLYFQHNELSGNIPESFGNLQNLRNLNLRGNQLSGSIPVQLGSLPNLTLVLLAQNDLTGSIPAELGNLTNLRRLELFENQLEGSIPSELGNLSNLEELVLHTNQLTGTIPPDLENLTNLEDLALGRNQLTGNIPVEIGDLSNLELLNLNGNSLAGNIPTSLTNLTVLIHANLGYNALTADDDTLRTFLTNKDPDWEETQTIGPEDVSATYLSETSIQVSWTPIAYTSGSGGYRVLYSMISGGPYTLFDTTANKSVSQTDVTGLNPNTTYYFVIQTRSNPHSGNPNTVDSEFSQEAFATTSTSSLSGRVAVSIAGHDDLAVINATIALQGTPYTTSTDGSGNFAFENMPPDTYTMTITSPNLIPVSQEVTVLESQILGVGTVQMSVITEQDLAQSVQNAVESWDVNGNGNIEFADIIYWLQVMAGTKSQ